MALSISSGGSGLLFRFEVMGETQILGMLPGMVGRIKDLRPIAEPIDELIRSDILDNFEKEGEARLKWPELAPSTIFGRTRRGFPGEHPILVNTGRLKQSFVAKGGEHIFVSMRDRIEIGSRVSYAVYHQSPSIRQKVTNPENPRYGEDKLPRRPIIYIVTKTISRLVQIMRQYIVGPRGR